ncbi:hypothetical protein VNI00_009664 [Paramarasmius palmivorus]|uniref:Protein CPL1-like domain-containing protein n=1 Tax=Paramarasmius palmivorus TaxID=297713 RepID=A0AAW0CRM3_9AGAR
MRLSNRLISTFLFFLLSSFSLLVPSVGAIRRRHSSKPENAIIAARQHHPRTPVSRDLIDLCINLDASLNLLPPLLKELLVGQADVCLCLKDLDIFINAKVKDLGILGKLINVPELKILLNGLVRLHTPLANELRAYLILSCTHKALNVLFLLTLTTFAPTTIPATSTAMMALRELAKHASACHPRGCAMACDPSPVPHARMARRSQITTLEAAKELCQGKEVCGVPSSKSKHAFECIDVKTTSDSCGGCVYPHPWETTETSLATGKDCTALATSSVLRSTCQDSRCVVDKCQPGFKPNPTGDDCIAIGHITRADVSDPTKIDLNPLGLDVVAITDFSVDAKVNLKRRDDADPVEVDLNPLGINSVVTLDVSGLNPTVNQLGEALVPSLIHPVDQTGSSSCPVSAPPPATPPTTLGDLTALAYHLLDQLLGVIYLGDLLGDQCGCQDAPPSSTGALVKGLIDLTASLSLDILQADPTDTAGLTTLLNQILDAANSCLAVDDLDSGLNGLINQVVDLVNKILAGLNLVPTGVEQCGCKSDLVGSLAGSLLARRADPCVAGGTSGSGSSAIADPSKPIHVDLQCAGLNGDVVADLGSLNPATNELLDPLLGPLVHADGVSPCARSSSGIPSGSASSATTPTSSPTSSRSVVSSSGSKAGTNDGGGDGDCKDCKGPSGSTDPSKPVLVDLTPIGVNAKATVDLGPELNTLINNLGSLLSPVIRPADSASGSSGSPAPPDLVADLHAALNLGSTMAATAKKLYTSCGCSGNSTSPVFVVVVLTAKLEGALQVMKADPTDATVSAVLKLVDAVLAASKTCSAVPGLKVDIVASVNALIGNCNHLAVSLKALLKGLKTCGCSEELAASVSGSASGSVARSKMFRKRYIGGSH